MESNWHPCASFHGLPRFGLNTLDGKVNDMEKEKSLSQKITSITSKLGEKMEINEPYGSGRINCNLHKFEKDELEMTYLIGSIIGGGVAAGYTSREVEYKGETVYEERGGRIITHLNGNWELELDNIYKSIAKKHVEGC